MLEKYINKVTCGDCLSVMKKLPDKCVDLILTDPPYILDDSKPGSCGVMNLNKFTRDDYSSLTNGFDVPNLFWEFHRVLKKFNLFCFCSNKQISRIMQWGENLGYFTTLLVWHKYNSAPFANGVWRQDLEFCVHIREKGAYFEGNAREKQKLWRGASVSNQIHPTQKPLELIGKYIKIGSNKGDLVLDCFGGSGTTARACKDLGRDFILIEKEKKYCEIAKQRLLQELLF